MESSKIEIPSPDPGASESQAQGTSSEIGRKLIRRLTKSEFARNASLLFTGTLVAQAVPAIISPILTRLYSPSEFGAFALFTSIATLIGIVGTGRYEFATLLPKSLRGASAVTGLVFLISAIVGIAAFVFFLINGATRWVTTPDLGPLTSVFFGIYPVVFGASQALNYQRNRIADFKKIAISRVTQAVASGGVQIIGGVLGFKSVALVLGNLIGQASCAAVLGFGLPIKKEAINFRSMFRQARRYWKFPTYSLAGDFVNTVANQMPVFILTSKFGLAAGGFYGLTQRILGMPMVLLANSVADVFKGQATRDFTQTGSCRRIYVKTFSTLAILSIFPSGVFAILGPELFRLFFGQKWVEAGEYARILSIMYFFRFVASPLGYTFYAVELQWLDMAWQITLCTVVAGTLWSTPTAAGPKIAILRFAIAYACMYVIYLSLSFYFTKKRGRKIA